MQENLGYLQTIKILDRSFKIFLVILVLVAVIFFIEGWHVLGFILGLLSIFTLGSRLGFNKGYFRGYGDGRKKGNN